MALIACPECESQVSDKAPTCPQCGYPISIEVESSIEAAPPETTKEDPESVEGTTYNAVLLDPGDSLIEVAKAVKRVANLSLRQSKTCVDNAPSTIVSNVSLRKAQEVKGALQDKGGAVNIVVYEGGDSFPEQDESRILPNQSTSEETEPRDLLNFLFVDAIVLFACYLYFNYFDGWERGDSLSEVSVLGWILLAVTCVGVLAFVATLVAWGWQMYEDRNQKPTG